MPKRALILLLCLYSVTCSPSSFSTSWPTTSRPSNPAWDLEVESAESHEQTDTQTNTVVESGDEPQPADGQNDSVVEQQNETPEQTEAVQQEAVAVSQQIEPVQQQSEQVSNIVQNIASVVEEQTQNAQPEPVAVVAEGQAQSNDQSLVEQPASQDIPQVAQDTPQVAEETQQTVQETQQTDQDTQQTVQETQQTVQETVQQTDGGLQANQPQVVVDPLNGSTMATSDNHYQYAIADTAEQTSEVQQQSNQVDQTQTLSENQVVVAQQEAEKEVQEGESDVGGSTPFPSSSSGILAVQESQGSSGPTVEPSAVTDSDHDDGYQIEDNYNVHQDSDEQNIVEKIKEIEEAEESEAESARWADAIATTQVIAFIVIAMVAVVVIYVLYIARKKVCKSIRSRTSPINRPKYREV